uniref:Transket_pyr domain-containing protein n=1 Tax=Steinernema glaseri TaxID=37863 RepID=A0A1I7ZY46_9BILA
MGSHLLIAKNVIPKAHFAKKGSQRTDIPFSLESVYPPGLKSTLREGARGHKTDPIFMAQEDCSATLGIAFSRAVNPELTLGAWSTSLSGTTDKIWVWPEDFFNAGRRRYCAHNAEAE